MTLAIYARTFEYPFLDLDDPIYITFNPHVLGGLTWEGVRWAFFELNAAAYWHPLTWISLMLDQSLFHGWAGGFHITNVCLHLLTLCLVFRLVHRLFGDVWTACLVAAVFGLHPMHQESVVWITERKDVLSTFWGLLALNGYVSWVRRRGWRLWLGFHLAFVLCLMSKPTLVVLPGILLLLDAWPLDRIDLGQLFSWREGRQAMAESWPRLLGLVREKLLLVGFAVLSAIVSLATHPAFHDQFPLDLWQRISNAVVSYPLYLAKYPLPLNLAIFYPFPLSIPVWQVLCAGLLLVAALGAALWQYRRRPWLLLGLGWFFLGLLTVIMPPSVGIHVAIADRWAYFPYIGCSIMVAFSLREAAERMFSAEETRAMAKWCALAALVCWFGGLGLADISNWRNSNTVYERALAVTEQNYFIESSYGGLLLRQGDLVGAEVHTKRALELAPRLGTALINMAKIYLSTGRFQQALEIFDRGIAVDPNYWGLLGDYHYGYGLCLANLGRYDEAERHYRTAIEEYHAGAEAHNDLGYLYILKGDLGRAARQFARAIELKPGYTVAMQNLLRVQQLLAPAQRP